MDARRRRQLLTMALLGATLIVTARAASARQFIWPGTWRLESPLGEVVGPFLATSHEGSWRCEIAVAEDGRWPSRDDLLHRRGRGWTLTGTPDGGFVQGWNEPWRELGPAATRSFGELVSIVIAGAVPREPAGPHRWRPVEGRHPRPVILDDWAGLPADWRPPAAGVATGGDLRRRLTTRGRGRGGDGLVLDIVWEAGVLVGTSARFPGRIAMSATGSEEADLPAEAYLPLWPLAEFLP